MDVQEMQWKGVDETDLAQERDNWQTCKNGHDPSNCTK